MKKSLILIEDTDDSHMSVDGRPIDDDDDDYYSDGGEEDDDDMIEL